ncbi:MAG: PHB depolymerase family esterase [Planctomycetota bacterium]
MSTTKTSAFIAVLVALLSAAGSPALAQQRGLRHILDDPGSPVRRVDVLAPGSDVPAWIPRARMLRDLAGVIASAEAGALRELRRAMPTRPRLMSEPAGEGRWRLNVAGTHSVRMLGTSSGDLVAVRASGREDGRVWVASVDERRFEAVSSAWHLPASSEPPDTDAWSDLPLGQPAEIPTTPVASPILFDDAETRRRFYEGGRSVYLGTTRTIENETAVVRLPRGYDPSKRWGVLVWVSPSVRGTPPGSVWRTADEFGLVCIGFNNSHNQRPAMDRVQLACDAVETVAAHVNLDRERVYVSGLSGGGRITSFLHRSAPDVFMGFVSIVGLNSEHQIHTGEANYYWRSSFSKPAGEIERLRLQRRIAAVTGPTDGNYNEMKNRTERLRRDGYEARFFDYPELGHTMCSPDQFREAFMWVDGPRREAAEAGLAEAESLLAEYRERFGETPPETDEARDLLDGVCQAAPWSEPALEAARLLGFAPGLGASG